MATILLDTNFISAVLVETDAHHQEALDRFKQLEEDQGAICFVVAAELMAHEDAEQMYKFCRSLDSLFLPNAESDLKFIYKNIDAQSRRQLKANDCLILALAYRFKLDILTFDKNLMRAHKKLGIKRP